MDPVLNFIANALSLQYSSFYVYPCAFLSPSLITSDFLSPDLILVTKKNDLCMLELTNGFQKSIYVNGDRNDSKYNPLSKELQTNYKQIKFISLSLGALGTVGSSCTSFVRLAFAAGVSNIRPAKAFNIE